MSLMAYCSYFLQSTRVNMAKYKRILLKVSGEALANESRTGIDNQEVGKLALQIKRLHDNGVQVGVVVGGGNFWRGRQSEDMDRGTADYIGMLATVMNSLALGSALQSNNVPVKVVSALSIDKVAETYFLPNVLKYLDENIVVVFGAGTGSPYFSTDTTATLRACEIHADAVLCAKNIDGVYDSDPRTNPKAKKFDNLTYHEVLAKNLKVLDFTATAMCMEYKIPLLVFGKDADILDVVNGKNVGTIIK